MKKNIFLLSVLSLFFSLSVSAQILVKTDFSSGLPSGWTNSALQGGKNWTFQSAPVFSSTSGGQYVVFDDDQPTTTNEAILQTPSFNCLGRTDVRVRFEHFWDDVEQTHGYVEVSNDGGTVWTSVFDDGVGDIGLITAPVEETIDISALAAGQSDVRVRFRFVNETSNAGKQWYIDDVVIFTEPDVSADYLVAPNYLDCSETYSNTETVTVRVYNYSPDPVSNVPVVCEITGGITQTLSETIAGPIPANSYIDYSFTTTVDMSAEAPYNFTVYTNLGTDEYIGNNQFHEGRHQYVQTYPYSENFNSGKGGWHETGNANRWFEFGTLPYLNGAEGEGNSWYCLTANTAADGSWITVESPVFDFTNQTNPLLSFDIKHQIHNDDYFHVEYSLNNGPWTQLGSTASATWYNATNWWRNTISSPVNVWTHVEHDLCLLSGEPCVKLRISGRPYYASHHYGAGHSDFAFDNITISATETDDIEVKRIVQPFTPACAGYTATEPLQIVVENNTCRALSNIPVKFSLDGGPDVNEIIPGPIPRFTESFYTFTNTLDLTAAGDHTISVTTELTTDGDNTNDNLVNTRNGDAINTFPYVEDFNSGTGGWVSVSASLNRFFEIGSLPFLNGAEGEGNSWYVVTKNNAADGSWISVESPVFDLSGLTNPILYMDIKHQIHNEDYFHVEYSINDGAWTQLGTSAMPNWYNTTSWWRNTISSPVNEWTNVTASLCDIGTPSCVKFRVRGRPYYGSHHYGAGHSDFAFDNFRIEGGQSDVGTVLFTQPAMSASNCLYASNQETTVRVYNYNCSAISNVPVECEIKRDGSVITTLTGTVPSIPAQSSVDYTFTGTFDMTPLGTYDFRTYTTLAGDANSANDEKTMQIIVGFPKINTYPYFEDFNSGKGYWVESGNANRYFEHGSLPYLNGAEGEGDSWYCLTANTSADGSWITVESPIFDFTNQTNPTFSMDIKHQVHNDDYFHVEYSLDGGTSWTQLGADASATWYNATNWWRNTISSPVNTWTRVEHELCELSGEPCVKFRIIGRPYYGSHHYGAGHSDFAFDNVGISTTEPDDVQPILFPLAHSGTCSGFTGTETVNIMVQNNTCRAISDLPIKIQLDGGTVIEDTVPGPINRFSQAFYTLADTYDFSAAGTHTISVETDLATDGTPSNDIVTETRINNTINTFPYSEDFDSGNAGWVSRADNTDRHFLLGELPYLNGAEGNGDSWYVHTQNSAANGAWIWVESPVFDISGLTNPIVYFDLKLGIHNDDYFHVEYQINDGTWTQLGDNTEPRWYNANDWWRNTGIQDEWTKYQHNLCDLGAPSCIKFRFRGRPYYGSHHYGTGHSDFAFDNFEIIDAIDVGAATYISPDAAASTCLYSPTQQVTATFYNWACQDAVNVPAECKIVRSGTDIATLTGTIPNIPANGHATFTFPTTFDMTPMGQYEFYTYTKLPGDNSKDNDSIYLSINVNFPKVASFPYEEDFNADNGDWVKTGTATRYFEWGALPYLDGPEGEGNSWYCMTATTSADGNWITVESPVFDMSTLTNPVLYMDIKHQVHNDDYFHVEYQINGGTWTQLGATEPNWYNTTSWWRNTISAPVSDWKTVNHDLCILAGESCVKFRVTGRPYYGSHHYGAGHSDFAFDNFRIVDNIQDVAAYQIDAPLAADEFCTYSGAEALTVRVYNFTCSDITSVPVKCDVTGVTTQSFSGSVDIPAQSSVTYTLPGTIDMQQLGTYNFDFYTDLATDYETANDTVKQSITVRYPLITSFPYYEDFNSGKGYWIESGNANRYFELDELPYLNGSEGRGDSWHCKTANTSADGSWIYVESPVFDLTGLVNPILSMEIKHQVHNEDYFQVQYSTNGGESWTQLGGAIHPDWYNATNWWRNSSSSPVNDWKYVAHNLCHLIDETCVKFRIAGRPYYGSHHYGAGHSDFAFDNFMITDSPFDVKPVFLSGCYGSEYGVDVQVRNMNNFCIAPGDVTSLDLTYSIDGGTPVTATYATNIVAGGFATINIPDLTIPSATSSIKVWTSMPNGVVDEIFMNDTIEANMADDGWATCNDHCSNAIEILTTITYATQTNNATDNASEDPAFSCYNFGPNDTDEGGAGDDIPITVENSVWYWFTTDCDGGELDVSFLNIGGTSCSNGIQVSIDRLDTPPVCDPANYTNVFCAFPDNTSDIIWSGNVGADEIYYITVDGVANGQCDFEILVEGAVAFDPDDALSGTYQIRTDNSSYPNFTAAIDSLEVYGIAGNVVFEAQDTIFNEQLSIDGICKSNDDFTVTFTSACEECNKPKIQYSSDDYTVVCGQDFDKSISFDGVDDYIEISNESNFDFEYTDAFTLEAWVKTTSTVDYTKILSKMYNASPYTGYELNMLADGRLHVFMINSWTGNVLEETSTNTINDGVWHHVAFTYDGSADAAGLKLFIDGAEESTTIVRNTLSGSIQNNYSLNIGKRNGTNSYMFAGEIDEVRIWGTERTPTQIADNACIPLVGDENHLKAYYQMNEGLGSVLSDASGSGNDAIHVYMCDWNTHEAQTINETTYMNFDGSNDYVLFPETNDFDISQGTIEAWIKTPNAGSNHRGIVIKQSAYGLFLYNNVLETFDWTGPGRISTGVNLADNAWHHIAMTFDDGVVDGSKIYIDGAEVLTFTYNISNQNEELVLGQGNDAVTSQNFAGNIDEVRVWSTIRTPIEINNNKDINLNGDEAGLLAYWDMELGADANLPDQTANGYNGTLINMDTPSDYIDSDIETNSTLPSVDISPDNYILSVTGAKGYNFDRIEFEALGSEKSRVLVLNNVENFSFDDCNFISPENPVITGTDQALVSSNEAFGSTNLDFQNCNFSGGSDVFNLVSTGSAISQLTILNNIFTNSSRAGVVLSNVVSPQISGNIFTTNSVRNDFTGFSLSDITTSLEIMNNKIYAISADGTGIYFNNVVSAPGTPGNIVNNMISLGVDAAGYGLNFENSTAYHNVWYNSINHSSSAGTNIRLNTTDNIVLQNNIFAGANVSTDFAANTNLTESHNNFFPDYASKNPANSISINPAFLSNDNLRTENSGLAFATPNAITVDIDGETRSITNPYMGADEFLGIVSWTGAINTDWNNTGNWSSNQIPTEGTTVMIPNVTNYPELNSSAGNLAETNHLTINSGSHLYLPQGKSLTVYGDLSLNGDLKLLSSSIGSASASLIVKGNLNYAGSFTVEQLISDNNWHYISSPVIGQNNFQFDKYNFYKYNETIEDQWLNDDFVGSGVMGWEPYLGVMNPMEGYIAYDFSGFKANFAGEPNHGNLNINLTYTDNTATHSDSKYDGWNLVGNPYPSYLNWNSDGVSFTNVDNAMYFYDDDGSNDFNNYRYYVVSSNNSPYPSIATNYANCFVPPVQSFFVRANAPGANIAVTNEARYHDDQPFYKNNNMQNTNLIRMRIYYGEMMDEAAIRFVEPATPEFDSKFDAFKLFSNSDTVPYIYSKTNKGDFFGMAINSYSNPDEELIIPVAVRTAHEGSYSITFPEFHLDQGYTAYFEDALEAKTVKIENGMTYKFYALGSNKPYDNRFCIKFSNEEILQQENIPIQVYSNLKNVHIRVNDLDLLGSRIIIYDLTGKRIIDTQLNSDFMTINMSRFANGNYFVEIRSESLFEKKLVFIGD